jgi:hypothetical protein
VLGVFNYCSVAVILLTHPPFPLNYFLGLSRASRFPIEPVMHLVCIPVHLCPPIHRKGIKLVAASSHLMTSTSVLSLDSIFLSSFLFFNDNLHTTQRCCPSQEYQVQRSRGLPSRLRLQYRRISRRFDLSSQVTSPLRARLGAIQSRADL